MSLNTVLAATLAALPLAFFSPAQAGESNGPGPDASNYGSWTFVQVQSASADAGSEAYISNGRFTEMAPDAVVADVGFERSVLAGKALSVDSMTARGSVAYARATASKQPRG